MKFKMNPFQKAAQAAKEANERRRRGNAARANAWSGAKYRERIKKSNEEFARYGGRPKPGVRSRTAKPAPKPRTAKPQNNFNYTKWYKNTFKNRRYYNQGYENNFEPESPPRRPQTVRTNNINNALIYFGYLSKNNMKSKGGKELRKRYLKLALLKHSNKGGNNENFKKLGIHYNKLKTYFPNFMF